MRHNAQNRTFQF